MSAHKLLSHNASTDPINGEKNGMTDTWSASASTSMRGRFLARAAPALCSPRFNKSSAAFPACARLPVYMVNPALCDAWNTLIKSHQLLRAGFSSCFQLLSRMRAHEMQEGYSHSIIFSSSAAERHGRGNPGMMCTTAMYPRMATVQGVQGVSQEKGRSHPARYQTCRQQQRHLPWLRLDAEGPPQ